jgi:hypothetical protein
MGVHEHLHRVLASAGLRGGHPFLDDSALVDLMLSLPPELSFDSAFDRPLLREACRDALPLRVLRRRTKSFFNAPMADALAGSDLPAIAAQLDPRQARIVKYVEPRAVERLLAAAASRRLDNAGAWQLARLVAAEAWLRALER